MQNYEVGQVWSYKTRESENDSKIIILKIDADYDETEIIHVCVEDVAIKTPDSHEKPIDYISHMPFSREAIDSSVIDIIDRIEVPDFSEGYNVWKEGYTKGEAGIFSIPVSKAVEYMETTINEGVGYADS